MNRILPIAICMGILAGCTPGPESESGFRLPDGDAEQGLQAFQDLRCYECHVVQGRELPFESTSDVSVTLGGDVTRVKTYGELVTSIINPSHKLAPGYRDDQVSIEGESLMTLANLNRTMTVQQLIDLVAFLQPTYKVRPPEHDPYRYMYP